MEACGLELKDTYTPDELKEIAKTFLEKDPGNVGDNLVGMSIRPYDMVKLYPTTTFSEACNIGDGYYKDENGQFQWAPADTRALDALKNYQVFTRKVFSILSSIAIHVIRVLRNFTFREHPV